MSTLELGTTTISMDEPCFYLREENLQAPDYRGFRRYQLITVVRCDRLATFRRDLGLASIFKTDQFVIPGGIRDEITKKIIIFHTVGELVDIADHYRGGGLESPLMETPDLWQQYFSELEEKQRRHTKRSSISALNPMLQRG